MLSNVQPRPAALCNCSPTLCPIMQAQVLSQKEAAKRLANARHSRDATLPVMFFGTLEIGWLQVRLPAL
jgi:hypothetical protein